MYIKFWLQKNFNNSYATLYDTLLIESAQVIE